MIQIFIVYIMVAALTLTSNGQRCIEMVNVGQRGRDDSNDRQQAIVPRSNFSCNGRITGYLMSLTQRNGNVQGHPIIQVWRSVSSTEFIRLDTECTLSSITMMTDDMGDEYYLGNVSCTNRNDFQIGDVIGYHQGNSVQYRMWNIPNAEFTTYSFDTDTQLDSVNINNADDIEVKQPLIQVMFDIRCDNLSAPDNGGISSCSSGRIGVGYEGDTCSFTCNTGYELTGSDTRTCQSNGSWSGSEITCTEVIIVSSANTASTRTSTSLSITRFSGSSASTRISITTSANPRISLTTSTNPTPNIDPTDSANIINASSTALMAATPSTDATREETDNTGSSVGGIVAGCVVAFIVFAGIVVCLIIFLLWYRAKKKRTYATKSRFHEQNGNNSTAGQNGIQIPKQNSPKSAVNGNQNYYPSEDQSHNTNAHSTNPMPYLDPVKIIGGDYEVSPVLQNYKHPLPKDMFDDVKYAVTGYPLFTTNYNINQSNTLQTSTSPAEEEGFEDEDIYKDPGHIKGEIYELLKQKNINKIYKDSISVSDFIGSGEFGTVHLGLWSNGSTDPVQVAVKTLNSQCSESDRVKFLREAAIMGQFIHNNVVQLHGVVTEEENMMIVLEYMPKGDLSSNLIKIKALTAKSQEADSELKHDLLSYCRQIAAGMSYLASKQFIHRDLAARNILVSSDDVCKITDFGMARDVADDHYYVAKGGKIPLRWTSPEAIFYQKYSVQSDVWSFGCVMYEIWSLGYKPFEDLCGNEYVEKIVTGYRLPPPPSCPKAIYELMIQCWHPEARFRPHPGLVLRTLQKSDRNLLQWSIPGDDRTDGQVAMLGAPLTASEHLYPDLQSLYMKTPS